MRTTTHTQAQRSKSVGTTLGTYHHVWPDTHRISRSRARMFGAIIPRAPVLPAHERNNAHAITATGRVLSISFVVPQFRSSGSAATRFAKYSIYSTRNETSWLGQARRAGYNPVAPPGPQAWWAGQIIVERLYTDPVHGSSIYPLATLSAAAASID